LTTAYNLENIFCFGNCIDVSRLFFVSKSRLTVNTSIVWFHSDLRHLAILRQERIPFATVVAEDSCAVEGEVKFRCEFSGGIAEEADLDLMSE